MRVLYIALFFLPWTAAAQDDPDLLYRNSTVLADAQRASAIWEQQVSTAPRRFESWWKLARAMYWPGGHETTEDARRRALERGVEAGRQAAVIEPMPPEGHFWIAASMGALAESFGLRQGSVVAARSGTRSNAS